MTTFTHLESRMLNWHITSLLGLLLSVSTTFAQTDNFEPLFDGVTLAGWEGNEEVFRVEDGAIVAGKPDSPIRSNEFLCTIEKFDDFELRLEARLIGRNAGVHFRGERISGSTEVGGYQADMGFVSGRLLARASDFTDADPDSTYPLWGSLIDEFRPDRSRYPDPSAPYWLFAVPDRDVVDNVLSPDGWNQLSIRAVGPRIAISLNGVQTVEYTEQEPVPRSGVICLQNHPRSAPGAFYKNIEIRKITR